VIRLLAAAAAFVVPASSANYSHHYRPASQVRLVVVHVTEGSFDGTISWFRNPHARAAANYVVGRDGRVAHMVPNDRIAWHAGNSYVNYHSVGVEHEGYTGVDGTVTEAEYRASARLVASLLRRYRLPADRGHVIGHNEVPDPRRRGAYGGFAHHTDPGTHWDWPRYMRYVRAYRAGATPPPRPLDVTIPGLTLGQTVTGLVGWSAAPAGEAVARVDFLVDGLVRTSVSEAPYAFGWDTALEENGRHVLTARAVGVDGRIAIASVVVRSETPPAPPPLVTLPELLPGQTVPAGLLTLTPALAGGPVARVELWIDGVKAQETTTAPWALTWDAAVATPGTHVVAARAIGPRGKATAAIVPVVVSPPQVP
jgi:hypothetical protein